MMWRAALAAATVVTLADAALAQAQFYGYEDYGRGRFWDQRPRNRQQWRDDYNGDWGYGGDYRREPITRSGGARPTILPVAPPKVAFHSNFAPNSIVIDSGGRSLYYVLSATEAYQYPISVGREGFSWTGTEVISRQQAWPDNQQQDHHRHADQEHRSPPERLQHDAADQGTDRPAHRKAGDPDADCRRPLARVQEHVPDQR